MAADERMLDLDKRRSIFRYIEEHPGLHLRGLQRALDIPLGTLEYHLHQMEKNGLLVSRDDGRFKAFFAAEGLDRRDKDILYFVRQEMPRQIIIQLLMSPDCTHSALVEKLPVSASTCSFHVKKLVKAEIVEEKRVGRSKHFRVADEERTANVLVTYRKSFLDDLVDRFARAWLDVGRETATAGSRDAEGGNAATAAPAPATAPANAEPVSQEQDDEDEKAKLSLGRWVVRGARWLLLALAGPPHKGTWPLDP